MKSKGSPSLYEVLKSASRPSGEGAPASSAPSGGASSSGGGESGPTLQERLAAYKAAKLAEAQAAAVATETPPSPPAPEPAAATVVVSAPAVRSEPVAPPPAEAGGSEEKPSERVPAPEAGPGLGERVVKLTYNTLAFAALVGVGLLFVAYALGVKVGRARAAEAAATETVRPAPPPRPPAPPPAPPKQYTIRLAEWRYATPRDRVTAEAEAEDLRKALERAGYRGAEKVKIERAGEPRLALYIDRWTDYASPAARERLAALQKFRLRNGTAPFAAAAFEEVPK